jgi:peptide methionine sulfoxide reductase msrA/msrB
MKKEIYLAGGCFWGTEHYFKQIQGVMSTEVGFANGYCHLPTALFDFARQAKDTTK